MVVRGLGPAELVWVASKCKQVGKSHSCIAVDESNTIAQWLAHLPGLPGKQVPGSNPGGAAWHFSNLACKVYFRECNS